MTRDEQIEQDIQARTQQLIGQQIGTLVLAHARLQAEKEVAAAIERRGTQDGARGADGPEKVVNISG